MDISGLPSDLEMFVKQEIARGKYQSEDELVTEALRQLRERAEQANGKTSRDETPQGNAQLVALQELVRELASLPIESPEDDFSVRDHDKLLYGEP